MAENIEAELGKKAAAAIARARIAKMKKIVADPRSYLKKADSLVTERTQKSYDEASSLLADLRDALADSDRADLADQRARALRKKYPT